MVELSLDAAERVATVAADEPFEPSAGPAASMLVNVPATIAIFRAYLAELRGDAEATAAFASQALAEVEAGEWMLEFITQGYLGVAEWLRGRLAEAEQCCQSSIAGWRAAGQRTLIAWGCYQLGQVQRAQGRLDAASETYRAGAGDTAPTGRPRAGRRLAYVGLAEVAYQRNELDAALRHVTEGIALCRQFVYTPPLATAWRRWRGSGRPPATPAGRWRRSARPGRPRPAGGGGLLNPVPAQRARLLLAQGDVDRGRALDDEPRPTARRRAGLPARARVSGAGPGTARPRPARPGAGAAGPAARRPRRRAGPAASSRFRRCGRWRWQPIGDGAAALDALAEALLLGLPAGLRAGLRRRGRADAGPGRPAGRGPADRTVRRTRRPARLLGPARARFRRARDRSGQPTPSRHGSAGPGRAADRREAEVLDLIAAGKSNPRIAEELVVTLDTVKKHVSHVLGKLGAANRTEAVTRARQLGLIA